MKREIEILSPAGSYESLKAAIAAGADAVYIGGSRFGARAYADNLNEEKMLEAIDYAHLHGRKIYLTVNTLLKEQELEKELYDYLLPYYKHGIDAVIVQDLGVLSFIKKHFPGLPIHASTQMTITDLLGAKFMEKQGVERIVTSREMSLSEIKEIFDHTDVEIESFVHGALCYCYSGQCLYSSLIGGRSGNRGQCAQPCRLPYKVDGNKNAEYVLSLKDMCTLEYIPELIEAGIYSFKIEGRMKKPEYVALVTKMYRKYVDLYFQKGKKGFRVDPADKEKLLDLYNRGGSHGGYYHKKNGRDMVSLKRPNHAGVPALRVIKSAGKSITCKALLDISAGDVVELPTEGENFTFASAVKKGQNVTFTTHKKQNLQKDMVLSRTRNESLIREIHETIINNKRKEKINGKLIISEGTSAKLVLYYGDIVVESVGEIVQSAKNQPMDAARIEKQIRKTGNTEFEFEKLEIEISGNVFMPMQSLNELRRIALEELERRIIEAYRREVKILPCDKSELSGSDASAALERCSGLYVYVEEVEQFKEAVKYESVRRIYLDANAVSHIWDNPQTKELLEEAHDSKKEIYLALPHIIRSTTKNILNAYKAFIFQLDWDGILIRNNESYEFLKENQYQGKIVSDYSMYHFNREAKKFWEKEQIESFTAPLELNYKELQDVGMSNGELIIYGHLPMMVSAQCIMNTTKGCRHQKGRLQFTDRYQKVFTARNCCDYCYNIIYNTLPLALSDQKEEIQKLAPKALRLQFTIENGETVKKVLTHFEEVFVKEWIQREPDFEFTRGHFKRGIK